MDSVLGNRSCMSGETVLDTMAGTHKIVPDQTSPTSSPLSLPSASIFLTIILMTDVWWELLGLFYSM